MNAPQPPTVAANEPLTALSTALRKPKGLGTPADSDLHLPADLVQTYLQEQVAEDEISGSPPELKPQSLVQRSVRIDGKTALEPACYCSHSRSRVRPPPGGSIGGKPTPQHICSSGIARRKLIRSAEALAGKGSGKEGILESAQTQWSQTCRANF